MAVVIHDAGPYGADDTAVGFGKIAKVIGILAEVGYIDLQFRLPENVPGRRVLPLGNKMASYKKSDNSGISDGRMGRMTAFMVESSLASVST